MLTLILAESELERIPTEILSHPAIVAFAQKQGKQPMQIILDSNYHHRAMTDLEEGRRRGRPDIVHLFLLTVLESIVNKQGRLNTIIHTRNNDVITVHPETRIMRSYERFIGLMEQLYERHVVPNETHPLLTLYPNVSLQQVIENATADHVMVCSRQGTPTDLSSYFQKVKQRQPHHILCIIGGFPSGTFHTDMSQFSKDVLSIYKEMLPAWTVASEILVHYEVAAL